MCVGKRFLKLKGDSAMKIIIMILFGFSSLVFASEQKCGEKLGAIVHAKPQVLKIDQKTYAFAALALKHYRTSTSPTSGVYIEKFIRYTKDGRRTGYKIDITDGGDESKVSYYLNRSGELVYAKWHNQSPEEYWFCR